MKAIGVHTFAGGICQGVRKHFDIIKCHEPLKFGVETLRERLGLRVVEEANASLWRRPATPVDFVFGNPRCGGFSGLGSNTGKLVAGGGRGESCRQSIDAEQVCRYGVMSGAKVVTFESVQGLYRSPANRGFVDRMMHEVFGTSRWRFAHCFISAASFGNPQYRRRYFFVAYRRGLSFNPTPPTPPEVMVTVGDVLEKVGFEERCFRPMKLRSKQCVDYDPFCYLDLTGDAAAIVPHLEQGFTPNTLHHAEGWQWFEQHGMPRFAQRSMNAKSKCPFGVSGNNIYRFAWDAPSPTLTGHCGEWIHPFSDRPLCIYELCALMGWDSGIYPAGPQPTEQIAKGIVPATGEWIAQAAYDSIAETDAVDFEMRWNAKTREVECREVDDDSEVDKVIDFTGMIPKKTANCFS